MKPRGRKPTHPSPLRDWRQARGWTQPRAVEWARSLGLRCSVRTWRAWEAGTNRPPPLIPRETFSESLAPENIPLTQR